MKWTEHNVVRCVHCNNRNVFSTGHCCAVICVLLLLIQNIYSLLSEDRGCTVMYPFTLLALECIHSMIGTLDIHPVHRECLTLHGIWSLWKCNHGLEDCFLLSRSENDKLVQGGKKCLKCQFHRRTIFLKCCSFIVSGV